MYCDSPFNAPSQFKWIEIELENKIQSDKPESESVALARRCYLFKFAVFISIVTLLKIEHDAYYNNINDKQ